MKMQTEIPGTPLPSKWILMLAVLCAFALLLWNSFTPATTMDYWWFLGSGKLFAEHGFASLSGPHPFSFTAPANSFFYDSEWLFQVALFYLWKAMGHAGPVLARAFIVLSLVYVFFRLCRRLGASLWIAWWVFALGATSVLLARLSIRPHILGYVFLLGLLEYILASKNKTKAALWVFGLFAVWANIHASFLLAGAIVGWFGLWGYLGPIVRKKWPQCTEHPSEQLPWMWIACSLILAVCINPHGWKLWQILWKTQHEMVGIFDLTTLPEWAPFSIQSVYGQFHVALVASVFVTGFLSRSWRHGERFGWLVLGSYIGFAGTRFTGVAFLLLAPLLAAQLTELPWRRVRIACLAVIMGITIWHFVGFMHVAPKLGFQPDMRKEPREVLSIFMKYPQLKGRIFSGLRPTGYLAFFAPQRTQFDYDARIITPGFSKWMHAYKHSLRSPKAWEQHCTQHRCSFTLVNLQKPHGQRLNQYLARHTQWRPIRFTLRWGLYVHTQAIRKHPFLRKEIFQVLRPPTSSFQEWPSHTGETIQKELRKLRSHRRHGAAAAQAIEALWTAHSMGLFGLKPLPNISSPQKQKLKLLQAKLLDALADTDHPYARLALGLILALRGHPRGHQQLLLSLRTYPRWLALRVIWIRYLVARNRSFEALQQLRLVHSMYPGLPLLKKLKKELSL